MQKTLIYTENLKNEKRLDIYLAENFSEISRSKLKKAIEEKSILLNGQKAKPSTVLKFGDKIEILYIFDEKLSNTNVIIPQKIDFDVIYEDNDVLVVYKKRGLVVHPASGNADGTLVNGLVNYLADKLSKINGIDRPGIVHRIDKDTSGLLLVAKTDFAHLDLAQQLKEHSIKREYTFICHGQLLEKTVIEQPLGRDEKNRLKFAVVPDGKYAYTTVEPIEIFDKYTYGRAILKTGRTHQIRVHMRYINRALVGDKMYSNYKETINGQLLHAGVIGFVHPRTKKYLEFSIKEPEIFESYLDRLRKNDIKN
ncbi:RluA family pseudouridine synthase [Criibacterium bergeronii]|uniref:Pseudouridine synthase n=1 Tax=Criibacterium bergeronii TaxID=1871336 RepID=A0A371IJK2_9FIRM|nr:RluA family pseudouridine synthase [Criibacterium bergeronii]MBS6063949.1 RluA family pseudouridine synthase [Peptostreptococcaceae bacterium]RDY20667.1 RluA family pseudouridine synthase [Criibacterium bergeronii]